MIAAAILILLGVYLGCGFLFALPFAFMGARKIDAHAAPGTWGFRLLIMPGAMGLWPVLLRRWMRGLPELPEESNAHRQAARLQSAPPSSLPPDAK